MFWVYLLSELVNKEACFSSEIVPVVSSHFLFYMHTQVHINKIVYAAIGLSSLNTDHKKYSLGNPKESSVFKTLLLYTMLYPPHLKNHCLKWRALEITAERVKKEALSIFKHVLIISQKRAENRRLLKEMVRQWVKCLFSKYLLHQGSEELLQVQIYSWHVEKRSDMGIFPH